MLHNRFKDFYYFQLGQPHPYPYSMYHIHTGTRPQHSVTGPTGNRICRSGQLHSTRADAVFVPTGWVETGVLGRSGCIILSRQKPVISRAFSCNLARNGAYIMHLGAGRFGTLCACCDVNEFNVVLIDSFRSEAISKRI